MQHLYNYIALRILYSFIDGIGVFFHQSQTFHNKQYKFIYIDHAFLMIISINAKKFRIDNIFDG